MSDKVDPPAVRSRLHPLETSRESSPAASSGHAPHSDRAKMIPPVPSPEALQAMQGLSLNGGYASRPIQAFQTRTSSSGSAKPRVLPSLKENSIIGERPESAPPGGTSVANNSDASHSTGQQQASPSSPFAAAIPSPATSAGAMLSSTGGVPADMHARILEFQKSRQRANSNASNRDHASSVPGSPAPLVGGGSSSGNAGNSSLSRSSSSGSSQSSAVQSPLMIPQPNDGGGVGSGASGGTSSPVSFSGALYSTAGMKLQPKKPSLSQRRGIAKLPGVDRSVEGPGSLGGALNSRPAVDRRGGGSGLFSNYKKYIDIKSGSLNFAGKASLHAKGIDFSSGSSFRISLAELEPMGELGRGNYGTVTKVLHKPTNVVMAMKEIRLELDETKFTQIIMELDILHKCASPYIVDFYGAFFVEGAVYVCMEYMDGGSLNKIYDGGVEEQYLAIITKDVVIGLKELKEKHNIIHRDVKPTNILTSTSGKVKLCDFGVSGRLVASIARTNIGCQSYMAPERILPPEGPRDPNRVVTYTVESDIWSLGLSILEIANGAYPYPAETYRTILSQINAIVAGNPPSLPADKYSPEAISFVNACLNKVPSLRPSYGELLEHPWLKKYDPAEVQLGKFVQGRLDALASRPGGASSEAKPPPPLHLGGYTNVAK